MHSLYIKQNSTQWITLFEAYFLPIAVSCSMRAATWRFKQDSRQAYQFRMS